VRRFSRSVVDGYSATVVPLPNELIQRCFLSLCGRTCLTGVPARATRAPPISGGTLAVESEGTAVLSDPDRDQVYIVDVAK
jgi:hypothetical protein